MASSKSEYVRPLTKKEKEKYGCRATKVGAYTIIAGECGLSSGGGDYADIMLSHLNEFVQNGKFKIISLSVNDTSAYASVNRYTACLLENER